MKVIIKKSISVFITIIILLSAVLVMDITASAEEVTNIPDTSNATDVPDNTDNGDNTNTNHTPESPDNTNNTDVNYVEVMVDITEETPPTEVFEKIQAVFNEARENATPQMQYKVMLPPGVFRLDGTLALYSNTFFDMNGSTLLRYHSRAASILKCGRAGDVSLGYEGFVNITVYNGTLDGWDKVMTPSTSNLVRMGHARNILFENVNFLNNCNSHCLELGACKGVTVKNCVFKDQYQVNGKTAPSEALQIDALHTKSFPLYESYDGTACRDIYVTGCTFENLTRGIGTHAVILDDNSYYDGIVITNNTFTNISDYAVLSLCWINSKVNNNEINNCNNGILIRSMRSDYRLMYDGETFTAPLKNYNVQLDNNTISTTSTCVRLYGVNVPKAVDWTYEEVTGTVPAGDYAIHNVSVTNNTLKSNNSAIRMYHAYSCKVMKNKVYYSGTNTGVTAVYSTDTSGSNIVSHNTIQNSSGKSMKAGILFSGDCKNNTIYNNTIKGNIQNGIYLYNGANSCKVNSNNITGTTSSGIYVYSSKNAVTNSNTVAPKTGNGIMIKKGSTSLSLEKNTVKGGIVGIGTSNASAGDVKGNVTSSSDYGLYFYNSKLKNVKNNSISSAKSNGIYFGDTSFSSVSSNNVSNSVCSGIYAFGSTGKVQNNTVKNSKKYGMYFDEDSKNNIYKNSFSSNKKGDIYLYSKKGIVTTNLATPKNLTSRNSAFDKTKLSWSKSKNAEYYRIYRSTDNKTFSHIASTEGNVDYYKDKNLTPGKNYYYKIIPVVHSGNTYVVGSQSNERRAKTGVVKAKIEKTIQNRSNAVRIVWNNSYTPEKYVVYKKEMGKSGFSVVAKVNGSALSYYDMKVTPGKTYYYKVRQICYGENNKLMTGEISNTVKIRTQIITNKITSVKRMNKSTVKISVNNSMGNTGYKIFYSTGINGKYKLLKTVNSNKNDSITVKLREGKKYYFKTMPFVKIGTKIYYGDYSNIKSI